MKKTTEIIVIDHYWCAVNNHYGRFVGFLFGKDKNDLQRKAIKYRVFIDGKIFSSFNLKDREGNINE